MPVDALLVCEAGGPACPCSGVYKAFSSTFLAAHFLIQTCEWWWLFPPVRGFGENVQQFIPCLLFFSFFFQVETNSHTKLIPLFRSGSVHSGSVSRDDRD